MADEHNAIRTIVNAFLLLAAPIPAIFFARELQTCDENAYWRQIFASNSLLASNVAFFVNVDIGFWLIACLQASTWLIDPYWYVNEQLRNNNMFCYLFSHRQVHLHAAFFRPPGH